MLSDKNKRKGKRGHFFCASALRNGYRIRATAFSSSGEMEELAAGVRAALPYITERRMGLLMKYFEENGVHSKGDMAKLEAVDLVNTLGTADAKKLVAYFHYGRLFHSEGVRTEALDGVKVAYEEVNTKMDEEHAKREQIHEETLCAVDKNVLEISEIHDATIENIREIKNQSSQAHKETLERMEEEDRLRAERRAQRQKEFEEELRRIESSRVNPATSFFNGMGKILNIGKEAKKLLKD